VGLATMIDLATTPVPVTLLILAVWILGVVILAVADGWRP
jgi:hypothetical protein